MTREAAGEAAYAAGKYEIALHEFRALRRMNGGTEFVAAMADCERALGHPDRALKLVRDGLKEATEFAQRVELRLVEAGVRLDMGQADEAKRVLRAEIEASAGKGSRAARIRLRYGYADVLEQSGDADAAERWFAAVAALDADGETDAADRVALLQGIVLEVDEDALVGDDPEPDSDESDSHADADAEEEAAEGEAEDAEEDASEESEVDTDGEAAEDESDDADEDALEESEDESDDAEEDASEESEDDTEDAAAEDESDEAEAAAADAVPDEDEDAEASESADEAEPHTPEASQSAADEPGEEPAQGELFPAASVQDELFPAAQSGGTASATPAKGAGEATE